MDTLKQIVEELRGLGKTQREVADLLGFEQEYISFIENGKRGARTPHETLERCKAVRDRILTQQ